MKGFFFRIRRSVGRVLRVRKRKLGLGPFSLGQKGKLSPRFIGPYDVLERIGPVAYRLALPSELAKLYDVFHVSMLWRYRSDESHILPMQEIQVQEDLSYDEGPKTILAQEVKQLRNKQVPLLKVLWQHHGGEKATWEPEATMRA